MYIAKEDEWYPDTLLTPFMDAKLNPVVIAIDQQTGRGIEVHLGPRSGRLVGSVIDANTKRAIEGAILMICRVSQPRDCHPLNANQVATGFSQLLPPVAFTMKASAPGHHDWYYGNDGSKRHGKSMKLAPGTTKSLVIALKPK